MPEQLSFFSSPQPECAGQVYMRDDGVWVAEIAGGWYVGHGKTRQAAIDAAVKAYETEMPYCDNCNGRFHAACVTEHDFSDDVELCPACSKPPKQICSIQRISPLNAEVELF